MRAGLGMVLALGSAVALTSVAAAGHDGAKQRVVITSELAQKRTFVLVPSTDGALKRDAGTVSVASDTPREVMRNGQKIAIYPRGVFTFTGKLGTFTLHERTEWVDVSTTPTRYGFPPGVATGTWKLVRGTGQYARVTGGGRSGHAGLGRPWLVQHEGFLTSR